MNRNVAINSGLCPNDARPLKHNRCKRCGFVLTVAAPVVINDRPTFYRRPVKKPIGR